jgi:tetratricopeptide (TPR) repeat protein
MFEFLKSEQWSLVRPKTNGKAPEPWSLDRNWHRSEAERHLKERNYTEALHHLTIAVEEAERRNLSAKQRVRFRLELADTQRRVAAQSPDEAENLLKAAEASARAAIVVAAQAGDPEEYVNCLDALADVFTDRKDFASLEALEKEALRRGAALTHPDPLRMAKRVHRLAVARHKLGNHVDALPALEKSITMHEQSWGPDSLEMGGLLFESGCIYRAQAQHEKAQDCLRRALRIHEKAYGPDSAEATADLQQLAGSYEDSGDLDKAAAQYERCLMLKLREIGVKHIEEAALMQYSLANLHAGWGNLARARELMTDCIGSFRRDGGPRLAVAFEMLAQIEERSGRYHSAIRELENGAKVWEKLGRPAELTNNMNYRADLLEQLRKFKEAGYLRERASALVAAPPSSKVIPINAQTA